MIALVVSQAHTANQGDRLIAQGLDAILADADITVRRVGLVPESKRVHTQTTSGRVRTVLGRCITPRMKRLLQWYGGGIRRRESRRYEHALRDATVLIVGGGQLLMDNELEFPLALDVLTSVAKRRGVPVHIVACGVGIHWTHGSKALLRRVVCRSASVSVRDSMSAEVLSQQCKLPHVPVVAEPSLMSPATRQATTPTTIVGIGVMSYQDMLQRRPALRRSLSAAQYYCRLLEVVQWAAASHRVELFVTGEPTDWKTLSDLVQSPELRALSSVRIAAIPETPEALVSMIARYRAMITFRLHASMAAVATRVPFIAIGWDSKVAAVLKEYGCSDRVLDITDFSVGSLAVREHLLTTVPDPADRLCVLGDALYGQIAGIKEGIAHACF